MPTISVKVNRLPTVKTDHCPFMFDVQGLISVSGGPIDLTYGWQDGPGQPVHDTKKLHFGGVGAQSKAVEFTVAAAGIQKDYTESLVVTDHLYTGSPGSVTFRITCGLILDAPVPANPNVTCGAKTTFSATIHTAVNQPVTAQWHFSDGSASNSFLVNVVSPDTVVGSPAVTINRNPGDLRGRFSATLSLDDSATEEAFKATGYVTCTPTAQG